MVPIIIFTAVLNLFFLTGQGDPLLHVGFVRIYREGVAMAIMMAVRIMCLIAGTSLLTYTTSPIELTDAIEVLMGPLKKIKVPVHEIAMMMTIALRFIPTLIEETDKIMNAQKARGADMETGSLTQRAKALIDPDSAVCLRLSPGRRTGAGDGVPLLPRKRRQNQNEAAGI